MSDYHVIDASTREGLYCASDYEAALAEYKRLSRTRAVNMIQLTSCGCVYRAIIKAHALRSWSGAKAKEPERKHRGWRRYETCAAHERKRKT